jgi:uncharacterized damage-inducible protein DinB
MSIIQMLLKEMDQEALTTRKMLERVANDKYDWKPHEKSMTVRELTTHIAELPAWIIMALTTDGLNFADNPYQPTLINNTSELLELFEKSFANGREHLAAATEQQLLPEWILRGGEEVLYIGTKGEVIRMTFSQIVHHRAQLGVYLRLLNIPIPGSYGPSADEH